MTRALRFGAVLLAALGAFGVEEAAAQSASVNAVFVPQTYRPASGDTYGFGVSDYRVAAEIQFFWIVLFRGMCHN